MTSSLWSLLVLAQVLGFALFAFPVGTLVESLRVIIGGPTPHRDAPEMAVGVFAALGRAAVVAGLNGAVLAIVFSLIWADRAERLWVGTTLVMVSLCCGYLLKLAVASPLERLAYVKHSKRQDKLAHKSS